MNYKPQFAMGYNNFSYIVKWLENPTSGGSSSSHILRSATSSLGSIKLLENLDKSIHSSPAQ
jgi:hypothetical protein